MSTPHEPPTGHNGSPTPRISLRKQSAAPTVDGGSPATPVNLHKQPPTSAADAGMPPRVNLAKTPATEPLPPASPAPPPPAAPPPAGMPPLYPPASPPYPVATPAVAGSTINLATLAIGFLAAIALVAVGATIYVLAGRSEPAGHSAVDDAQSASAAAEAVACATAPQLTIDSVRMTSAGLAISTEMSASCADGDVVTDPQFGIAVSDGSSDVAAGLFDLGTGPVIIPPGEQVSRTFVFPPTTLTATQYAAPAVAGPDQAALTALQDLAASDRGAVARDLENRWAPQISSKRPGLYAEGITWTPSEILREHLSLRQRYPDVKLVWSGDWRTFNDPDWWVTTVGLPYPTADGALGWCANNGFDADHCYAKIISRTRGVDGTTVLRK